MDIYRGGWNSPIWTAPYYDISKELPKLYQQIKTCEVFDVIHRVRIIESMCNIHAHSDDRRDMFYVRAMLHNTDPESQWFFTSTTSTERHYLNLPEDTNWFAYNDAHCLHGSDYRPEHPKLLVQFYGDYWQEPQVIARSKNKYKEYTITL